MEEAVSESSVGMVWVGRWAGVWMRVSKQEWVLVVEVGLGEWRMVSGHSVVEELRGMAVALVPPVSGGVMVVAGARGCTALPGLRCNGSFLATALGVTATERFEVLLVK